MAGVPSIRVKALSSRSSRSRYPPFRFASSPPASATPALAGGPVHGGLTSIPPSPHASRKTSARRTRGRGLGSQAESKLIPYLFHCSTPASGFRDVRVRHCGCLDLAAPLL